MAENVNKIQNRVEEHLGAIIATGKYWQYPYLVCAANG